MNKENAGNIEVFRESLPFARFRSYEILADGEKVGSIKNGATTLIPLPHGGHRISIKLDWTKSNEVTVNIEHGKTIKLNIDYKRQKDWKHVAMTSTWIALFLAGVIFGISGLVGLGIGGFMVSRIGKLHLYQPNQT